jgi:hypothetical protein
MRNLKTLLIDACIALPALAVSGQQTGEVTVTVTDASGRLWPEQR